MFSKSIILGTLFSFIVLFISAWLFYSFLAASYFEAHSNMPPSDTMSIPFIALGTLFQAYAMSVIFAQFHKESQGFIASGFRFGVLMGLFVGFGIGMLMYGTSELMDLQAHLVDAAWNILYYGITGVSIGVAFRITRNKE